MVHYCCRSLQLLVIAFAPRSATPRSPSASPLRVVVPYKVGRIAAGRGSIHGRITIVSGQERQAAEWTRLRVERHSLVLQIGTLVEKLVLEIRVVKVELSTDDGHAVARQV
jgi:hypothetical protein